MPRLLHPLSHPVPAPVNPVRGVQAVLGFARTAEKNGSEEQVRQQVAEVSWRLPQTADEQEQDCAWRDWEHEVRVSLSGEIAGIHTVERGSNRTRIRVAEFGAVYSFQIRATSRGTASPWSESFRTKSFDKETSVAQAELAMLSSRGRVVRTDLYGRHEEQDKEERLSNALVTTEDVEKCTIVNKLLSSHFSQDLVGNDKFAVLTDGSSILARRRTATTDTVLASAVEGTTCLALEPVARNVYFSGPSRLGVARVSYDGGGDAGAVTVVSSRGGAVALAVDSIVAKLCWVTAGRRVGK